MTKEQLLKFIRIRNRSEFTSNLQFGIDADEAGFKVEELGSPSRTWDESGQANGYRWETPFGELRERWFKLALFDRAGEQVFPGQINVGLRVD